jgi:hypothetical protein
MSSLSRLGRGFNPDFPSAQEEDGSDFEVSEAEVKISKSDDLGMRKSNEHGFQWNSAEIFVMLIRCSK